MNISECHDYLKLVDAKDGSTDELKIQCVDSLPQTRLNISLNEAASNQNLVMQAKYNGTMAHA